MIAAERFKELAEYQIFLAQVDAIHFPVFQSDMTPADFLDMLKTVSNICKKCHDLGDATVGVPLYSLVRDLCISGCSTKIDISSFFLQELIDTATLCTLRCVCIFLHIKEMKQLHRPQQASGKKADNMVIARLSGEKIGH